ncbi:uncharacterized protein LOC134204849 [Armigeres subalbatus]|uniref:uncharacterized protein LOC134204849 n=1 Tax=Armigeres subalbatus TaxID=124917 RepID=UPI002ED45ED0
MASDSVNVEQTSLDYTETACSICGPSTQDEEMVRCDGCSGWFHSRCLGIVEGNLPKRWFCLSEACQEMAKESQKKKTVKKHQTRSQKEADDSDKSSTNAHLVASSVEAKVRALEERQKRQMEKLEVEMQLRKKEKEMQRALERKKVEIELQMRAEEEEEQRAWQAEMLQKKKEQMDRMKASQKTFEEQMSAMDKKMADLSTSNAPKLSKLKADDSRAGNSSKIQQNVWKLTQKHVKMLEGDDEDNEEEDEDADKEGETESSSRSSEKGAKSHNSRKIRKLLVKVSQDGLGLQQTRPTKAQLAARNGLTCKLPKFSGKPAQWPLFYAAYKASNDDCGYMNHENLMRLQEALEGAQLHGYLGDALELVSGQLLLPESIPRVIEKLRRHFGRPEQLLESLLDKVNRLDSPKPDNLRSFIPFGNTVEQLCGHLEAADLRQHLVNPLLIKSLVAKLPDREKREWIHYRRGRGETTLRTLTDFLMEIVDDACEANVDFDFNKSYSTQCSIEDEMNDSEEDDASCRHCKVSSFSRVSEHERMASCRLCQSTNHHIRQCASFKKLQYGERLKVTTREKLCLICLNEHVGQCKFRIHCNVGDCRERHNPLMHPVENATGLSAHMNTKCDVLFRIVPVKIHCGQKSATVLAFLDEGASVTLIDKKLADHLGAVGEPERLTIHWTGDVSRVEESQRIRLCVSNTNSGTNAKMLLHTVHTVEKLKLPHQKLDYKELAAQYKHLRGLHIESYNGQPQLLIGANNIHTFVPTDARAGELLEPIAVRTNLGWTIYGPKQSIRATAGHYLGHHQLENDKVMVKKAAVTINFNKPPLSKKSGNKKSETIEDTGNIEARVSKVGTIGCANEDPAFRSNIFNKKRKLRRKCNIDGVVNGINRGCCQSTREISGTGVTVNPRMTDVTGWGVAKPLVNPWLSSSDQFDSSCTTVIVTKDERMCVSCGRHIQKVNKKV